MKITELDSMTETIASADFLPLVDASESHTVKITIAQLLALVAPLSSNTRQVRMIEDVSEAGTTVDITTTTFGGYENADAFVSWAWGFSSGQKTEVSTANLSGNSVQVKPEQDCDTVILVTDLITGGA